jgi:hypothetical protein
VPGEWVIFAANLLSPVLFCVLGYVARTQGQVAADSVVAWPVSLTALAVGALATGVITLGRPFIAPRTSQYLQWLILRLALAEATAAVALAGFLLGSTSLAFVVVLAWSTGLILLCMPTQADRGAWEQARRGR